LLKKQRDEDLEFKHY
jgi:hypothetical protein